VFGQVRSKSWDQELGLELIITVKFNFSRFSTFCLECSKVWGWKNVGYHVTVTCVCFVYAALTLSMATEFSDADDDGEFGGFEVNFICY